MLIALQVVEETYGKHGLDTIVTSGNDSQHMEGSLHYKGAALDFRTTHAAGIGKGLVAGIAQILHPLGFDVLFENPGTPNEHCHVEYDPR